MKYSIQNKHISTIKAGDTILHDGDLKTVSNSNIKTGGLLGITIFGDSYHSGYKPVKLAIIYHAKPKVKSSWK